MKHTPNWLWTGLECCGVLAVLVSLPLIALTMFMLRVVLVGAAFAALAGAILLYGFSPRFRGWLKQAVAGPAPWRQVAATTGGRWRR